MSNIKITKTMLDKSICDCNKSVRDLLRDQGIIDYDELEAGEREEIDVTLLVRVGKGWEAWDSKLSCYRANGRGDKRIWVSGFKKHAKEGDVLELRVIKGEVYVRLRSSS